MAAIASTNVTVVVEDRTTANKKKKVTGTIAFGDGALTYPTGGVPLPAMGSFGFVRNIDSISVYGNDGATSMNLLMYDKTNHKLVIHRYDGASAGKADFEEMANSVAPAAKTYRFVAWGW